MPQGQTTPGSGTNTWTLVQNPNSVSVKIRVTYLPLASEYLPACTPQEGSRTDGSGRGCCRIVTGAVTEGVLRQRLIDVFLFFPVENVVALEAEDLALFHLLENFSFRVGLRDVDLFL